MFGLQALDGILQDLITKARSNQIEISHGVLQLLTKLHHKATLTARKAQPFINASDTDYYRLGFLARHAWHFKREFRNLDTSLSHGMHFNQNVEFAFVDGKTMDQCISELIGDQRSGARTCDITDQCWRFIRSQNTQGYMTTHQALYFMIGEVKGCLPIIKKRLLRSRSNRTENIEDIFEALCANIYKEVRWREGVLSYQQRSRDAGEKDLYMEQCYVCGILGYHKFLSLDRLWVILGWQLRSGCYGVKPSNDNASDVEKKNVDKVEEDWDDSDDNDRNLPGGCYRHVTGVGTGLLGVYLKWLLIFPSEEHILM